MSFLFSFFKRTKKPKNTGMPDPHISQIHNSVGHVNMVCGTDKNKITLYKPDNAVFEVTPLVSRNAGSRVSLLADDKTWRAAIGAVIYSETRSGEPFADYYFSGKLGLLKKISILPCLMLTKRTKRLLRRRLLTESA